MRPSVLNPLFAPVTSLAGIGPKLGAVLTKLLRGGNGRDTAPVAGLLFHMPSGVVDRRNQPKIAGAIEGELVTLRVVVGRHEAPPRGNNRVPYRVHAHDDTDDMTLVWFRAQAAWLEKLLPEGEVRFVSGRVERFNGRASIVHPDFVVSEAELASMPLVEPVYPLASGITHKVMQKAVRTALDALPDLPEWLDPAVLARDRLPDIRTALDNVHRPQSELDVRPDSRAWQRLAYDELLAGQLALALVRDRMKRSAGTAWVGNGARSRAVRAALPYALTGAQERSVIEIEADMARPQRMLRMLQGDVGAGKTVVALLAACTAIEAGGQAAIMAPTEVLARQHRDSLRPLAEAAGIRLAILTGREKGKERERVYGGIADGSIDLLVGTHALFQEPVSFANLALGIVDEQHRFGVHQRLALAAKGSGTDILVMTATPIPRTLVLTYFGDMDVSKLDEKPANRLPIKTNALPLERTGDLVNRIVGAVERGEKAYWICPLVEDSDEVDATSAEARHATLRGLLGERVGLVHGRMRSAEKDAAMLAFKEGRTRVLVSTTVVEVGVDVPDATIMVIENAERFGLAQLHQLRGRVGRGDRPSICLLLYKAPLGEVSRARIEIMRESEDGFRLAEEDLRLRGEGEVLGTRQSGTPGFQLARMEHHARLLEIARDDARLLMAKDPELSGPRGEALRVLLYLFQKDEAVRLLRAG